MFLAYVLVEKHRGGRLVDIINCKGCGKLFNALTRKRLCPECTKALEQKFLEVKRYIQDNKGAPINHVATECNVSVKQIREWVKEERLSLTEGSVDKFECEKCGKQILTGRFCGECKKKISNNFNKALNKGEQPTVGKKGHDKDRMRFLSDL